MTFLGLAEKILDENQIPMKADDIWEYGVEKGYNEQVNSSGKTPWATLSAQLYVNVRDNKDSKFSATDSRPKRFFLKSFKNIEELIEKADNEEIKKIESKEKELKKKSYLEKELHPILAYYAYNHLKCYTKTINHSKSSKKRFGEWVHPDMVGCHFLMKELHSDFSKLSRAVGNPAIKIFSFELKREITLANLREAFFQTVSNSSWANESYLVAAEIAEKVELENELKRLSASFGIGVIQLNVHDPDSSEIRFPSANRDVLDWETMGKLTANKDFNEFLEQVNNNLTSTKIYKEQFDKIIDKEKLVAKFNQNK